MNDSLFCVEDLTVAYRAGQKAVVKNVSFVLQPGERLGLVGESGCGKSTLGRAAMRLLSESAQIEGRVKFEGKSVFDLSAIELQKFRGEAVALIFQDPMTRLDPLMTIGDHCVETLKSHEPHLSTKAAKQRAIDTLKAVNIPENRWSQYPHEFSGGMRQRVAIALALLLNPKLIVADEPTTSLDVTVSAQILKELTRLCSERNMALILISHDLAMIAEYCDRIAVMYDSEIIETGSTESVFRHPQQEYTRTLINSALHLQNDSDSIVVNDRVSVAPILQLSDLKQHYTIESNFILRLFDKDDRTIRAVDGIDLELYPGETLGLVGESGCGKSTLSRTILQLLRPTSGKVEFFGQNLTQLNRGQLQQQRRQIQMIFQDPHACLNPRMTIGESIADPLLIHQLATPGKAKQEVEYVLERVGLTPVESFYHRYPGELSGGQQQRVAIARALITRPKLVICDEPVSMLDATVQTQVLQLMQELKKEFDLTYLFITHDLWVARYFCDRIAVMNGGKIVELGDTQTIFKHPQHPYTQSLLGAAPLLNKMTG
ncbi:MAG: ABC transporter ATP-binding protein [Leptolyngbya sp. ERB_1_1]